MKVARSVLRERRRSNALLLPDAGEGHGRQLFSWQGDNIRTLKKAACAALINAGAAVTTWRRGRYTINVRRA